MLFYSQKSGRIFTASGVLLHVGYSGHGQGKNNPSMQHVERVGPIPRGVYNLGEPREHSEHGPFAIPLIPVAGNSMFGRSAFMAHGERIAPPAGEASEGCIIAPLPVRVLMHENHTQLVVIEDEQLLLRAAA